MFNRVGNAPRGEPAATRGAVPTRLNIFHQAFNQPFLALNRPDG